MTAPGIGAGPVPIVGFATGVVSPRDPATGLATGKRQHKPVVVRRAIDGLDATVLTKAAQNATLGTITIEVQRPEGSVHTYTYTNTRAVAVEDAGAAGAGVSTQELQFVYEKVDISIGGVLASDDWSAPVA
jgi:type VI secretion system secreted protein Hcp